MKPFPLDISKKFEHNQFGFIPSKKFTKIKRDYFCEPRNPLINIFAITYNNLKLYTVQHYHTLLKEPDIPDILITLNKIIPIEYFGSWLNKKRIFFIIKRILTQTRGECIHMSFLYEDYDYDSFIWLNRKKCIKDQVLDANVLLLQTVVKPFIRYFYYYLNKFRTKEFLIVYNGRMHSFTDSHIAKYIKLGYLEKVKSSRPRVTGAIRFIPKKVSALSDARPILLNYPTPWPLDQVKGNLKNLTKLFQIESEKCLYEKWKKLQEVTLKRRKLYAIKLDLHDAFGMVEIDVLIDIIKNDQNYLTEKQKEFLCDMISRQFVHTQGSKNIYKWRRGLLQGMTLSPILCELYLSYLTYNNIRHFKKPNTLIHRTVDDFLFVSTCEEDIFEFELAVLRIFVINENKTEKYLCTGENPHMLFCGKVFNMASREISNSYVFEKDTEMRIKFKFWNPVHQLDDPYEFIINSMKFSYVNFAFSKFELNTTVNSAERVLRNIFDGFCFVAFKLDCAVETISYVFRDFKHRYDVIMKCLNYIFGRYCSFIMKIITEHRGRHYLENAFNFRLLKHLARRAFLIVFQKRQGKYQLVIEELKRVTYCRVKNFDRYFLKLPKQFSNIKMRRSQKYEK